MDEPSRPLDERAEQHAQAVRAVMKELGPQLRGMPLDEAEERLVAVLRERDVFVPPELVRTLARTAADPWRDFKHPLKAAKLRRENARQADNESQRAEAEIWD